MVFEICDRTTSEIAFTAIRCDLIFGSSAELRQVAEVYGTDDGHGRMVRDIVAAWNKVIVLDRFDIC